MVKRWPAVQYTDGEMRTKGLRRRFPTSATSGYSHRQVLPNRSVVPSSTQTIGRTEELKCETRAEKRSEFDHKTHVGENKPSPTLDTLFRHSIPNTSVNSIALFRRHPKLHKGLIILFAHFGLLVPTVVGEPSPHHGKP